MAYLLLVLTTLFWSGNFVISRGMHAEIPPFALSFWRWLIALLLISIIGFPRLWRQREVALQHRNFILTQGVLGVAAFNSLVYLAVQTTTAINAVLVNSCIPVLIALFSWLMFKETLIWRQGIGVAISLCGVVLIIVRGNLDSLLHLDVNRGDLFVFTAAIVWAIYSCNLKKYPAALDPLAYLTGIIVTGVVTILPFYGFEIFQGKQMSVTTGSVVTVFYVALFASVLAFIFWNRAVREVGANKAGPFIHLMPVFSSILAILFLGEKLQPFHLFGISLIFFGIGLATIYIKR